jgi:tetratricopeptide (TPR) repeat protein
MRCTAYSDEAKIVAASMSPGIQGARFASLQGKCDETLSLLSGIQSDDATRLRAVVWLAEGKHAEARDALLQIEPSQSVAVWLDHLGMHATQDGDNAAGVQLLSMSRELGALSAATTRAYSVNLLRTGHSDEAIAVLRELVGRVPNDAAAHDILAAELWTAHPGDPEAVAEERQAIGLRDYFPYHARLGGFYRDLGRISEATHEWQLVLAVGVDQFDALLQLGDLSEERRDYAEAAHYYEQAIALQPRDDARADLARVCQWLEALSLPSEPCH